MDDGDYHIDDCIFHYQGSLFIFLNQLLLYLQCYLCYLAGRNDHGQTKVPLGTYLQISAGEVS